MSKGTQKAASRENKGEMPTGGGGYVRTPRKSAATNSAGCFGGRHSARVHTVCIKIPAAANKLD
jgi:hypothetical protein